MALDDEFQKSYLSNANGCVEVARRGNHVALRDSKHRDGPVLTFTVDEWDAFLRGLLEDRLEPVGES